MKRALTIEEQRLSRDFAQLKDSNEYGRYFVLINTVLKRLLDWIGLRGKRDHVVRDLEPMIDCLLNTILLLEIKYSHNPHHELALDLNESGFPHAVSIFNLESDIANRDSKISALPKLEVLKNILIDRLLSEGVQTEDVLTELATCQYFNLLDPQSMFLRFTPGRLERLDSDSEKLRRYIFTWAVYGESYNMPYFHSLVFEQDSTREPMENFGDDWKNFLKIISFSSRCVPQIGTLIHEIDDHSNHIHPKFLQRIQIGPIFNPLTSVGDVGSEFCRLLQEFGDENDFVLELRFETIISKGSQIGQGLFSTKGKVREVFLIPPDDREAFENRATSVERRLMLPHVVMQNINRGESYFSPYKKHKTITYTKEGVLNGN